MSFRLLAFAGALVAICSPILRGDEPLTPERAVTIAIAENRDLIAARLAIQEAQARLQQTGLRPNPDVELSHSSDLLFANEGEYNLSLGFRQRFPITGRLAKAAAVARVDVVMAKAEVRNQERLLAGEVLWHARELLIIQKRIKTNQEIQAALRELIGVSDKRLKAAEVSAADVNLLKLELQRATLAEVALLSEQESAMARLNGLLGHDPETPLRLAGSLGLRVDASQSTSVDREALARRPDRRLAELKINRAAADATLARAEKWEDWTIGLDYGRDYTRFVAPVGGKLDNSLGVSVSIPLPLWNKNQGKVREAVVNRERAAAELNALDLRIASEITSAEKRMVKLDAGLRQFRSQSSQLATDNLALLQKGYAAGLVNITAVIQAQQQLREVRQTYLDTLEQFIRAKTEWETATALVLPGDRPNQAMP